MFGKRLFPGGIHPKEGPGGKTVNQANPIEEMPAPKRVVIPMSQHGGAPAKVIVAKGDPVRVGQKIGEATAFVSAPVHASVSGTVVDVIHTMTFNGTEVEAVIIENDFKDEWATLPVPQDPENMTAKEMIGVIREAGIVGMGGATFPTPVKLTIAPDKKFEKLIVNGAECEPYLTADHRLMLEHAPEIIDAVRLIQRAFSVPEAIIGVEDNKPDAIGALRAAAEGYSFIQVQPLPVRYPQGGEKQLIYALTRRVVPAGGLPIDAGCVVLNAGTCYAIHRALREGEPLIRRVTTVGGLVAEPKNLMVRLGTPVRDLIRAAGGTLPETRTLISGGPMMGTAFTDIDIPVTKGCSGILALGKEAIDPEEGPCIRCGRCMCACPMNLQPVRMDHAIRAKVFDKADRLGVMNCIECGACTFVCPAKRLLTQSFRAGKRIVGIRRRQQKAREDAEKAAMAAHEAAQDDKRKEG